MRFSVETILRRWLVREITRSPLCVLSVMNRKRSTRCCGWSFSHGQEWCGYVNFDRESGQESERSGEDLPVALSPPLDSCVRACVRVLCNRVARELPNWVCGVPRRFGKVVVKLGENLYHPDERSIRLFALKVLCWVILYGGTPKCTRVYII